ncbi:MAG: VWA domain-containing protein, partial [Pirellulaceae bacterium]|nr:VWA domain-containing protein [Pirellulaceae bacterium]
MMTTIRCFREVGTSMLMGIVALLASASDGRSESSIARWATYDAEAGQTFYALSLQADIRALSSNEAAKRVVVIVDTSASQTGIFRTESLAIAKAFTEGLPNDSKLAIVACDIESVDFSEGLQSKSSPAIQKALKKLDDRLPLGTTDLAGALRTAQRILGEDTDGSIVYIGDGVVRSHVLNKDEFKNLIAGLVRSKTSVNSMAIGPFVNIEGLATLANHTGGRVFVRQNIQATTQQIGQSLANAAIEPVFWVEDSELPKSLSNRLPENIPPIRSDRDSVWVGLISDSDGDANSEERIVLRGTLGGIQRELVWKAVREKSNPDFAFLMAVVEQAKSDKGLYLPTAGSDSLRGLSLSMSNNASHMVESGRFALQSGDTEGALRIADEALKRDPNNLEAQNLRDAIQQKMDSASLPRKAKFVQVAATEDIFGNPLTDPFAPAPVAEVTDAAPAVPVERAPATSFPNALIVPAVPTPAGSGYTTPTSDGLYELATAGDMLSQEEGLRRLRTERFQTEVEARLRDARSQVARDPDGVYDSLKLLRDQIRSATDLDPGVIAQLKNKVTSAIESSSRSAALFREQRARAEAVITQASATERLLADRERATASVQQLVERFNALMTQQLYSEANTEIAPVINDLLPDTAISRAVEVESSIASNQAVIEDLVYQRRRGFIDVMLLTEKVSIPFADEPPVVFPPADVWRALSARRLERFGSIDLAAGTSTAEKRIYGALKNPVKPDFNATPLRSVMETWAIENQIPIFIDTAALELDGTVSAEDPVTLQGIPEISLRSALRLVLDPKELTYVIEDEVMKITTKGEGSGRVLRIYPVGDLVVPIMSMGGGMMGGG